jgi:aminoglycoside phosphotransferase (APT) family kinase protein
MSNLKTVVEGYLRQALPDAANVEVSGPGRLGAATGAEMFALELKYVAAGAQRSEDLVLRVYRGADAPVRAAHEFHCMRALGDSGYPVPRVLLGAGADSPVGPFVLMERVRGEEMWTSLRAADEAGRQSRLKLFARLLARLHALDWRPFAVGEEEYAAPGSYAFVDRWLSEARGALTRLAPDGFRPLREWLWRQRDSMRCERPAVVHWDFHPGNVLLRGDGSAVVVDWGELHVTDARFDLAWTLLLTELHGAAGWRAEVLREYERLTGGAVERLETFEAFACARRLLDKAVPLMSRGEPQSVDDAEQLGREAHHVHRVYERLRRLTGVRVFEVEELSARLP